MPSHLEGGGPGSTEGQIRGSQQLGISIGMDLSVQIGGRHRLTNAFSHGHIGGSEQKAGLRISPSNGPSDFDLARQAPEGPHGPTQFFRSPELGLTVIDLSPSMAGQLGYQGLAGALIVDVDQGRLAQRAGLRHGMLIVRVGEKPVKNVAEFRAAVEQSSLKTGITLELRTRQGNLVATLKSS